MPPCARFPSVLIAIICLLSIPGSLLAGESEGPLDASSSLSAAECQDCHEEIYQEWSASMHASSTALDDPIHGAFYRRLIGDPSEEGLRSASGKYPSCLLCHAPNAALAKSTRLDSSPTFRQGVNCSFCHSIVAYAPGENAGGGLKLGIHAYELSNTGLVIQADEDHPFVAVDAKPVGNLCMGCHDQRSNSHGLPLCATGPEMANSEAPDACLECHMPRIDGRRSHSMMGGHSAEIVGKAVEIELELEESEEGFIATVVLENTVPHKFPTGAPFRMAYLKLTTWSAEGDLLWQSSESHPSKDDPKALLWFSLGDDQGRPAMPPKATQVLSDSRLEGHESRQWTYTFPGENVSLVRAELIYQLLPPKLMTDLSEVLSEDLVTPTIAAFAEVKVAN